MWSRTAVAFTIALLHAAHAYALKADVVVLVNGDRITCEVKTLSRGQLTVSTDDAGTLTIKWDKVVSISTAERYDISTSNGQRLTGRLDAATGGMLAVVDESGAIVRTMVLDEVVSLAAIRKTFFAKIDGAIDVGASYTQSSGVSQNSFDGNATYREQGFSVTARGSATITSEPDQETSTRLSTLVGYTRYRKNRWVVSPFALFESNKDLGFDRRYTGAFTIGRYLVQTNRGFVLLAGGGALGREVPVDNPPVVNVDALTVFDAEFFTYNYPRTSVQLAVQVFPGLSDPGRVRINTNVKFRRELIRDLSFAVSAYDNYDNRPSDEANTNDIGYSLSLGWVF